MSMSRVMFRCPATGDPAPTQLSLDPHTFATIQLPSFVVVCRVCGELHRWTRDDVWLDGAETPAGR